jgi:hypothetical protein
MMTLLHLDVFSLGTGPFGLNDDPFHTKYIISQVYMRELESVKEGKPRYLFAPGAPVSSGYLRPKFI